MISPILLSAQSEVVKFNVHVECQNLSDGIGAKDDIVLLAFIEGSQFDSAILVKQMDFVPDTMAQTFEWSFQLSDEAEEVSFYLVERDQKLSEYQLEAIFRIYAGSIVNEYDPRNSETLVKYLSKDDLLGFHKTSIGNMKESYNFMIKGEKLFDWFKYSIWFDK